MVESVLSGSSKHTNKSTGKGQGSRMRTRSQTKASRRGTSGGEGHSEEVSFDTKDSEHPPTPSLSVMDIVILGLVSVLLSSGIFVGVYGYREMVERVSNFGLVDVIFPLVLYAGLIGLIMYILLRLAAHYIVYLGIGVLLNLIFIHRPNTAKSKLRQMFDKS